MLKTKRLKQISEYINDQGIFPTSIVLNIKVEKPLKFDKFDRKKEEGGKDSVIGILHLPQTYKSAWVIDGQHRLYAFADNPWATKSTLPVIAFENMPPEKQAKLFVDINHEQVKVPKNLLVDLAADLYWRSPRDEDQLYALHSKIAGAMGKDLRSPLKGRMATEGKTQNWERPVTLTGLYEALRKSQLVGAIHKKKLYPGPLYETDGVTSLERAIEILSSYLNLFAKRLKEHWPLGSSEGGYLCTNNGLTALFIVLSEVANHIDRFSDEKLENDSPDKFIEKIADFVEPIIKYFEQADLGIIKQFRRNVGAVGQKNSAFAMMERIQKHKNTFNPFGLSDYIRSQDKAGTSRARQIIPEVQLNIRLITMTLLKEKYGQEEDGWWRQGVPQKIRSEVAARREVSPERGELESFFELIDYKKIASANWQLFEDYLGIGNKRKKDYKLKWFDKLNTLRNKIAHPERGNVSDEEVDFLEKISKEIELRAKEL